MASDKDVVVKPSGFPIVLAVLFVLMLVVSVVLVLFEVLSFNIFLKVVLPILVILLVLILVKIFASSYISKVKEGGFVSHFPEFKLDEAIDDYVRCVIRVPMVYDSEGCMKKSFNLGSGTKDKILWKKLREKYNPLRFHHFFVRFDKLEVNHLVHNRLWSFDEELRRVKEFANDLASSPVDSVNVIRRRFDPDTNEVSFEEVVSQPKDAVVVKEPEKVKDFVMKDGGS